MPENAKEAPPTPNVSDEKNSPIVVRKELPKWITVFLAVLVFIIGALASYFLGSVLGGVNNPGTLAPRPKVAAPFPLTLESPSAGSLTVNNEVLVKGRTRPNATVMIYSDTDTTSAQADTSGNFESTIKLSTGINTLNVTAFSNDGSQKDLSIDIVRDSGS